MAADMEIGRQAYRETYITLRPLRKPWAFFLLVSTPLAAGKVLIANVIRFFQATGNVHIGSLAALFADSSLMAAFAWKPDAQQPGFVACCLNVRFSPKRTFMHPKIHQNQGPLSARSGPQPPQYSSVIFCGYRDKTHVRSLYSDLREHSLIREQE